MDLSQTLRRSVVLVALLLATPVSSASAQGSGLATGTYRCSSYNVSGAGGSCRNAPPLVLSPDGGYQYSSTRGRWVARDNRLHLSESALWGPGEILGGDTIRFEYDYRGARHVMTWTCQDCVRGGGGWPPAPGATIPPGASVGVSLTLEFGAPVGGVSGFTIVPGEFARSYDHNAPLPAGAVQGLAWETSRTAVALATNRNNKLVTGKRYVVFLAWPRETLPVAILDLPAVTEDYTATLRATLDGAYVLAGLGQRSVPPAVPPPAAPPAAGPAAPRQDPAPEPTGRKPPATGPGEEGSFARALQDFASAMEQLSKAVGGGDKPAAGPGAATGTPAAPRRPIGVEITDVTPEIAQAVGNSSLRGAGVVRVVAGGPASRAGVQEGDIITAVNGVVIASASEGAAVLARRGPGEEARLVLFRGGRFLDLRVADD